MRESRMPGSGRGDRGNPVPYRDCKKWSQGGREPCSNTLGDFSNHAAADLSGNLLLNLVFGLCRLLGIKLMPRMRGLSDAVFYRPTKAIRYRHIDALFGDEIDWDLIATHARDMFQVALSIQAGRVMPSMLLRKLGTYSRRNLLYRAFRELGRVERTLFLLRFVSSADVRRTIRAETTKIESFNDFLDWISFGGPIVKSGDPVEQEKQLKYVSLVANAVMLSNVSDLTGVLTSMAEEKHIVTPELVACLSPYTREHIRRFGQYVLDMSDLPAPLEPQPLPFGPAL